MKFIEIQMEQWSRRTHYEHYTNHVCCSYSLTVEIEVSGLLSALKAKGMKAYPAQIYMLSTVVNQFQEFGMSTNEENRLGYWNVVHPVYTVLNPNTKTFSAIWTKYDKCFHTFYRTCLDDIAQYASGILFPQSDLPKHVFNISSIPWLDFTSFNLNVASDDNYLLPIFTLGKLKEKDDKMFMSLALQCHHAVCDGFHVGRLVDALRDMAINWAEWLS